MPSPAAATPAPAESRDRSAGPAPTESRPVRPIVEPAASSGEPLRLPVLPAPYRDMATQQRIFTLSLIGKYDSTETGVNWDCDSCGHHRLVVWFRTCDRVVITGWRCGSGPVTAWLSQAGGVVPDL